MASRRRPGRNTKPTMPPVPPHFNAGGGDASLNPQKSAEPGTMTPVGFLRSICLTFHRPELASREGTVLFSNQGQVCLVDVWNQSGVPCLQPLQESAGIDIGSLPLAVTLPDGTPGSAIAVSLAAAEKLVAVVSLISHFQEFDNE